MPLMWCCFFINKKIKVTTHANSKNRLSEHGKLVVKNQCLLQWKYMTWKIYNWTGKKLSKNNSLCSWHIPFFFIRTILGNKKQLLTTELQCRMEKVASRETFGLTVQQVEVEGYTPSSEQHEHAVQQWEKAKSSQVPQAKIKVRLFVLACCWLAVVPTRLGRPWAAQAYSPQAGFLQSSWSWC